MHNQTQRGTKIQRGMALVGTMLMLLGIMSILLLGLLSSGTGGSSGLMAETGNAVQMAGQRTRVTAALNLAEAGVEYAHLWLSSQSAPPAATSAFGPDLWGKNAGLSASARTVVLFPDADNTFSVSLCPDSTNSGSIVKRYLVEAIGTSRGVRQIIHAFIQEGSFSKYAFFNDASSGGYWASNNRYFDGPVHFNSFGQTIGIVWRDNTQPLIDYTGADAFSVSTPTIHWAHNVQSNGPNSPPVTDADWATVSAGGAASVKWGQPDVPMPTASTVQRDACLNGQAAPTATGASVLPGGGIYIHGDAQQMTLAATGPNNTVQTLTLYQTQADGSKVGTVVTIDPALNQTSVQTSATPAGGGPAVVTTSVASGTTNGVVYCDGNIGGQGDPLTGGLRGTVADNLLDAQGRTVHASGLTIATDETKDVNIDGPLVYSTRRTLKTDTGGNPLYRDANGSVTTSAAGNIPIYTKESADAGQFAARAGRLGIVSRTVEMLDKTYSADGTSVTGNLDTEEVDAAVLAYNTYEVYKSDTRPKGTFLNMGSFLIRNGARINRVDGTGAILNGPYFSRLYDDRLADTPPPYYPTTGNDYKIVSWQRVAETDLIVAP